MTRLEVVGLTKTYGAVTAVEDLTFSALPGRVTGFLGANGAGKSTTLRILLGLVGPDRGSATVAGVPYQALPDPTGTVGAVLDLAGAHPGMSARAHLRLVAMLGGHSRAGLDEVLDRVGLSGVSDRPVKGFSTGMRQRLALAAALVGDPDVLVLDEPTSGLDPVGIAWLRGVFREWAAEGRTVLVSSHQLAEVEQFADDAVLIDHGRLVCSGPLAELTGGGRSLEDVFLAGAGLAPAGGGPR